MNNRVLIIEDDTDLQQSLKDILEFKNLEVWTADDGIQAFEMINSQTFDLIISDILMPGMDGITFLSEFKKRKDLENIPIILLSGRSEAIDQRFGMEQGADDYLFKPVPAKILVNAVFSCLEKKKSREAWVINRLNLARNEDRKIIFHELRTPLAGLTSIFEILEDMLESFDPIEFSKLLQMGRQSAYRINGNLNKLIMYNKIEDISPIYSNYVFDLNKLSTLSKIHFKRLTILVWNYSEPIFVDISLFEFLIGELIENAVKFSAPDDSIFVSFKNGSFSISNPQQISKRIGYFIPEPFTQVNRKIVEQQGLGLGLFLCSRIATILKGYLNCQIDANYQFNVTLSL